MPGIAPGHVDYMSLLRLSDRGCVVLGSGPGMGKATVNALAQAGARVMCVDTDEKNLQEVAKEVNADIFKADITKRKEVERVFNQAKATLGRVDGVVDIVGYNRMKLLTEFDDEDINWLYDVVLKHVYLTIQIGAQTMTERGGAMVFVGSNSGLVSFEMQSVYGALKAGLHHLVKCAAIELGPRGIRINAVAPGFTRVPRLTTALPAEAWDEINNVIPLRRSNEPSDVAGAILFLISDLSRQITGHTLVIDGGQTLSAPIPDLDWSNLKKK